MVAAGCLVVAKEAFEVLAAGEFRDEEGTVCLAVAGLGLKEFESGQRLC